MSDKTNERIFQEEVIADLLQNGWLLGDPSDYNRKLALYGEDLIGFVQDTQAKQWEKYCSLYPGNPKAKLLEKVAAQLNKADPNAAERTLRTFGTLGVLRHEIKDRGARFFLCQFIVVTDRTVLDNQLQDTISQFVHVDGIADRLARSDEDLEQSILQLSTPQKTRPQKTHHHANQHPHPPTLPNPRPPSKQDEISHLPPPPKFTVQFPHSSILPPS